MRRVLAIGSANREKARELATLLKGLSWEVKGLADFPAAPEVSEDGDSFEANAIKKARHYAAHLGVACVADDSGLVVDALGGAPGVCSARYAGEPCDYTKNNEKLLKALAEVPWPERTGRFVCCVAFTEPGGTPHVELGAVEGHIATACYGVGGFGYDPLFVPAGYDRTFGEMTPKLKHSLSHRGIALGKLRVYLEELE